MPSPGFGRRSGYGWLAVSAAIVLVAVVIWAATATGRRPGPAGKFVAVLPLDNLTVDPEQDVLGRGLHEELIFRLDLMQPRPRGRGTDLGDGLSARAQDGCRGRAASCRWIHARGQRPARGARFRITAQLIRGDDQSRIGPDLRPVSSDLLSLEADIAARVADALAGRSLASRFRLGLRAIRRITEGCLRGLPARALFLEPAHTRDRANLARAEAELLRALAAQPDYADAYVALADTYDSMIFSAGAVATKLLEQARTAASTRPRARPAPRRVTWHGGYIAMHFDVIGTRRSGRPALARASPNDAPRGWKRLAAAADCPAPLRRGRTRGERHRASTRWRAFLEYREG